MVSEPLVYRDYWKSLILFSLPIALQNLIFTALNMLDVYMVGQLGETSIAAVALCNQIGFIHVLFLFGISSGSSIFVAQFWGKRDLQGLWKAQSMALFAAVASAFLVALMALLIPRTLLRIFTKDQAVIELGASFMRIASLGYLFQSIIVVFQSSLRSTGSVRIPLVCSFISLSLNALFNYILIFGKLGFPVLGIKGAAIATSAARILDAGLLIFIVYSKKKAPAVPLKNLKLPETEFVRRFIKRTLPVVLNELGWATGIAFYAFTMARIGTYALAAFNVAENVSRLTLVLFIGMGNGAAILLGNKIGEGERDKVAFFTRRLMAALPLLALVFSTALYFLAPVVPSLFKIEPGTVILVIAFMRIFSIFLPFKISNLMMIVGIFRSGGDTIFSMVMDLLFLWGVSIPLVLVTGLLLHWPPERVYLLAMIEEVMKYFLGMHRVWSRKWVQDVTVS